MEPIELGRERDDEDGCRRYRPIEVSFDLTIRTLTQEVGEDWEEPIRKQWFANQAGIRESLLHRFGVADYEAKIENYIALDVAPISIVSTHNDILNQCRHAFVMHYYYPALLGVAGLGERILNELILTLRGDFKSSEHYKKVYNKGSIDDWDLATNILKDWDVVSAETAAMFGKLKKLRNESIHYQNQNLHLSARNEALAAIQLIQSIVENVFSPYKLAANHVFHADNIMFFTRSAEDVPLIRRFFLPASALVSPRHTFAFVGRTGHVTVEDDVEYQAADPDKHALTDEEFAAAFAMDPA